MNQPTQPPAQQQAPPPAQPPPPPGYAPPQPEAPAKGGTSCWLIGCIVALVLVAILATLGYFGWRKYQAKLTEVSQTIGEQLELDAGGTQQPTIINEGGSNSSGSNSSGSNSSVSNSSGSNAGGSASGGSVAAIPSPMPTLNAFLEDAGNGDGQAMAQRMTPQARAVFGEIADMWGQGDWEHDSFAVVSQQKDSDERWIFEVTETMRDWETNEPFYSTYTIHLHWNGAAWQVTAFEM